jgi:hypothetical protein
VVTPKKPGTPYDVFQDDTPDNLDASLPVISGATVTSQNNLLASPLVISAAPGTSQGDLASLTGGSGNLVPLGKLANIDIISNLNFSPVPTTETIKSANSGIVFVNTYGSGVTWAFHDAIVKAENDLQSHFSNSVTLNMSFDLQNIDDKNADGSWKFSGKNFYGDSIVHVNYADLKNALTTHATTADDRAAVSLLPGTDPSGGQTFDVPIGMARILGLASAGTGTDDKIILNDHLSWTFGDDAVGVIEHEISEGAMGRVSELGVVPGDNGHWAPMDLFRYSATTALPVPILGQIISIQIPVPGHDYTGGKDGLATYFSVDGFNLLTQFHNSIDTKGNFDGSDLADWDFSISGDAFGPGGPGGPGTLSNVDLKVLDVLGWSPALNRIDFLAKDVDLTHFAITRTGLGLDLATTEAKSINSGGHTETQYIQDLLAHAADTTIPAVAVEASMYGAFGTSDEITSLATHFLPDQVQNAISNGLDPQVYASEALGLAFAFGNEKGSIAFADAFGPAQAAMPDSSGGDAVFAAAAARTIFGSASTDNLVNAIDAWVANWKALYDSNGIPGITDPSAAQIDLAARGAAWGDAVGVALGNDLGPLKGQVTSFLLDAAAQASAVNSASSAGEATHADATIGSAPSADASVHLTGLAAHVDHFLG